MTSIPDSDSNTDYAFGYADVTPVPSVKDGTPVNPYTPYTSDKVGGDGFDLAWAVELGSMKPVKINNAKYVRIYSAVLYNTGIFGETSPEITGIFRAVGTTGSAATSDLMLVSTALIPTTNGGYQEVDAGSYRIRSTEENVYLNETAVDASTPYQFTVESGKTYRIVTQSGTEAPYITVIKGK